MVIKALENPRTKWSFKSKRKRLEKPWECWFHQHNMLISPLTTTYFCQLQGITTTHSFAHFQATFSLVTANVLQKPRVFKARFLVGSLTWDGGPFSNRCLCTGTEKIEQYSQEKRWFVVWPCCLKHMGWVSQARPKKIEQYSQDGKTMIRCLTMLSRFRPPFCRRLLAPKIKDI